MKINSIYSRTAEALLLLFFYCAVTLLSLWPWPLHFATGFPDHFDPPFHAWKLQVEADKLLRKHQLIPDPDTNIYYPYANELYFDALLWPQGAVAALLKAVGCGPILVYNVVMLFFWGLSGLFMYLLLRELALSRFAAFFGGLAMCLIPYRISYYVEFNMQMCFGLPLFLFFWLRFVRKPDSVSAVGLALAFWLQAVSELYQAVILALVFPLLVAPALQPFIRRHGRSLRIYGYVALSLLVASILCYFYLNPYFTLFHGGYGRGIREMLNHSLEPLAYLGPTLTKLLYQVDFAEAVKTDEMSVFPSFTLLFLWGAAVLTRFGGGHGQRLAPKYLLLLGRLRVFSLCLFPILLWLLCRLHPSSKADMLFLILGNGCLVTAFVATCILGFFSSQGRRQQFLAGLANAALLCFILSLGPALRVLWETHQVPNLLFSFVNGFFPLDGFRVMSRFSIFVMLFLIVSASVFLHRLLREKKIPALPLAAVLLASFYAEARLLPHAFARFPLELSPQVHQAVQVRNHGSLVVVPMGDRYLDARYMLKIGGTENLLVNGFGGFSPSLQLKISRALGKRPERAFNLIESIWPKPLVIVDKKALSPLVGKGYKTDHAKIHARGRMVASDRRFAVYQLREQVIPQDEYRKFVRADLLHNNLAYHFEARAVGPDGGRQYLFVLFNGLVVDRVELDTTWREYTVRLPRRGIANVDYEMIFLRGLRERTWTARRGSFVPDTGGVEVSRGKMLIYSEQITRAGFPAWLYAVPALPVGEHAVQLGLGARIQLAGIGLDTQTVRPGDDFVLRSYWSIPVKQGKPSQQVRVEFQGRDGQTFMHTFPLLHRQPLSFFLSRPVDKLFLEQIHIHVPDHMTPGRYRILVSLHKKDNGLSWGRDTRQHGAGADTRLRLQIVK